MTIKPQIPTADEIIRPAIDKLVARLPQSLQYINYKAGVWAHLFAGLRSQAVLLLRRHVQAAQANRLPLSEDTDLLGLIDSEFFTSIDTSPTTALGECTFTRSTGPLAGGVIPKGTTISRTSVQGGPLTYTSVQYQVTEDTYFPSLANSISVRIAATRSGADSNHVTSPVGGIVSFSVTAPLFDSNIGINSSSFHAAGGSDGIKNAEARNIAKANAIGQYGPTNSALIAGALLAGARHVAEVDDPTTGTARLYLADANWSYSNAWLADVAKRINDESYQGFGCVFNVNPVVNQFIHAEVNILLRDPNFLKDTSEVRAAVQAAIRSYFDDRDDWYTWTNNGLAAAVTRAHRNILVCTSAIIKPIDTNIPLSQPVSTSLDYTAFSQTHYYLANNGVVFTFAGPT